MNIFQFLGLPANHRTGNNITQLVKHFDEVPDSKKYDELYLAEIKMDGIFCHMVKKGAASFEFFSRTGMRYTSTEFLKWEASNRWSDIPNGVYIAELICPICHLEALSGIYNPNRVKDLNGDQKSWVNNSELWFHDYLTLEDFISGESKLTASQRLSILEDYLRGKASVIPYHLVKPDYMQEYTDALVKKGYEGVVFKRRTETWLAGHKGYKSMKIVRGVSYDLECIDVEEGKGKYKGKVANLIFRWKEGKTVKAMLGKGWTHDDAKTMFENYTRGSWYPLRSIFTVTALQESSKGVLRLPKVGALRFDKTEPDV